MAELPRILTAVVTPFSCDGLITDDSLLDMLNLINYSLNNNCGVVIFGTTGETSTLTKKEKIKILQYIRSNIHVDYFDTHIFVGIGGNDTNKCVKFANICYELGYKNIMATVPYYNKPQQDGLVKHFQEINDKTMSEKIILYNIPSRTSLNMLPETIKKVCDTCKKIVGVKEASGNLEQIKNVIDMNSDVKVYSGDDSMVVDVMKLGGYGVISVLSNILPKQLNEVVQMFISETNDEKTVTNKLMDILRQKISVLFIESNPVPIKFLLKEVKLIKNSCVRLPLVELTDMSKFKVLTQYCDLF